MLTIGLFKIPFGFEVVQSDRDRLFMERSTAERALFPGEFDVGRASLGWVALRALRDRRAERRAGGREGTWPGRDPTPPRTSPGASGSRRRSATRFWIAAGVLGALRQGISPRNTDHQDHRPMERRQPERRRRVPGEIRAVPGMAATPSRNFIRFGYGADLRLGLDGAGPRHDRALRRALRRPGPGSRHPPADPYGSLVARPARARRLRRADAGSRPALRRRAFATTIYDPDRDSADPARPLVPTSFSYQTLSVVGAALLGPVRLTAEYDRNVNHNGRDSAGNPPEPRQRHVRRSGPGGVLMRASDVLRRALVALLAIGAAACTDASSDPGLNARCACSGTACSTSRARSAPSRPPTRPRRWAQRQHQHRLSRRGGPAHFREPRWGRRPS